MDEPWNRFEAFRYTSWDFDESTGLLQLEYACDDELRFVETYEFVIPEDGAKNLDAVRRAIALLHLIAGVSYYKAFVPPTLRVESAVISEQLRDALTTLYVEGLGEFAYENQLELSGRVQFVGNLTANWSPTRVEVHDEALVAVGGGKDSCVSIESVRAMGIPTRLISVNIAPPIQRVIDVSNLESICVRRKIDPQLFTLNELGALNGHVPVTAIVTTAAFVQALLLGANAVVMSNERSASEGNVVWDGRVVNHQWSKSFVAEALLGDLFGAITRNVEVFSLLRPFSELDIATRFASLRQYHPVFTSCNRAFAISEERRLNQWCGDCPKCRFVFLALATALSPMELVDMFGANLLDDVDQAAGFDALIGWMANKPFECVGEREESLAAFCLVADRREWESFAVVRRFVTDVWPKLSIDEAERARIMAKPFRACDEHRIPPRFQGVFYERR